jgi:hypothetical protein
VQAASALQCLAQRGPYDSMNMHVNPPCARPPPSDRRAGGATSL